MLVLAVFYFGTLEFSFWPFIRMSNKSPTLNMIYWGSSFFYLNKTDIKCNLSAKQLKAVNELEYLCRGTIRFRAFSVKPVIKQDFDLFVLVMTGIDSNDWLCRMVALKPEDGR